MSKISDVLINIKGNKTKVNKDLWLHTGDLPIISQDSTDNITNFVNSSKFKPITDLPIVVFGDHTCMFKYIDFEFVRGADGTQLLKPSEKYNILFFYYLLCNIKKYIPDANKYQRHFKYLKELDISNYEFDIHNQNRIAAVLSTIDAKIHLNNRINTELETMAKTLYDYWFVQFDFPDKNGKPYKSSGGKMVWNAELKREIPEGWKVDCIGHFSKLTRGVTYNKEDVTIPEDNQSTPILRATNISNSEIDLNDMVYIPKSLVLGDQYLNMFDILIVMSSGSKEHIGKNAFFYYESKIAYGAFCSKLKIQPLYKYFVNIFMHSDYFKKYINNYCLGTNINNLTNDHITECSLPVPSDIEILIQFNNQVNSLFNKIGLNIRENKQLTNIRDWLLPMLMNGQVKVT